MEAMASQVMVGLEEKIEKLESDSKKTSQYKAILKKQKQLYALNGEYRALDKMQNKLQAEINDDINDFNEYTNPSRHSTLQTLSWFNSKLNFTFDRWKIKKEVEEKLTVALIKPDAKKYIEKILLQVVDSIKL